MAIIKRFADRVIDLCDKDYLEKELCGIGDLFVANGYPSGRMRRYMEETHRRNDSEQEEEEDRGTVIIPCNLQTRKKAERD